LIAALTLALTAISCSDKGPTEANSLGDNQTPAPPTAPQARQPLIFPVTPNQSFTSTGSATVPAGTVFTVGSVKITKFYYENGTLFVDGVLRDASGADISAFSKAPVESFTSSGAPTQPTCQILNLDIGAIHLNLLGLVVDLAPVHLDITAVTGPGNLLGNLLCALVGILDPPGPLAAILALIDRINAILAGL
jgi:hypothetical protein